MATTQAPETAQVVPAVGSAIELPGPAVSATVDITTQKVPTVAAGDHEAMASLWLQWLRPLPSSRRLAVLVKFFLMLPPSYCSAVMWAITSPRVTKRWAGLVEPAPEQAVEAIMQLWDNTLRHLDGAGKTKAFRSFLEGIRDDERDLFIKALDGVLDEANTGRKG